MLIENRYMFNSKGDNFIMTILKPHLQEPDALIRHLLLPWKHKTDCETNLTPVYAQY